MESSLNILLYKILQKGVIRYKKFRRKEVLGMVFANTKFRSQEKRNIIKKVQKSKNSF